MEMSIEEQELDPEISYMPFCTELKFILWLMENYKKIKLNSAMRGIRVRKAIFG